VETQSSSIKEREEIANNGRDKKYVLELGKC